MNDPQMIVKGRVKESREEGGPEIIVFKIPLALFELVCIAPIPDEGINEVPVYIKFKLNWRLHQPPESQNIYRTDRGEGPRRVYERFPRNERSDRMSPQDG